MISYGPISEVNKINKKVKSDQKAQCSKRCLLKLFEMPPPHKSYSFV